MSEEYPSSQNPEDLGFIEIDGKSYSLETLLGIDDLDEAYMKQAPLYAFIAMKVSEAELEYDMAVQQRELVYAEADEYYRRKFDDLGQKVTESAIKSAVIQDRDYGEAMEKELKAKHRHRTLKQIAQALEQRSRMLTSLGAHRRAEMDMTNMTIKKREQEDTVEEVRRTLRRRRKQK